MKARYFSPNSKQNIENVSSPLEKNLRFVKSTSKLIVYTPTIQKNEQRIGKYTYKLNKLLGKGFSSRVYYGYQTDNHQAQCAVKIIDLKNFRSSDLELLQNQISILKQLNHPNILQLYDVIKVENFCYIITEYCEQNDLSVHLLEKGKLQEQQSLVVLHDIIEGYKYLIKNKIIHRDLKPANILKGKFNWKIADFGFAVKNSKQFKAKDNVGTPLYMPPQSLVKNLYSAKSDIFSIGIIFYQALTGTTPWESKTQKELLRKMLNNPFHIPSYYNLSHQVQNILHKLCCVDLRLRMTKDQFLKFTVYNIYNEPTLHRGNVTLTQENPESLSLPLTCSLNLAALVSPKNQSEGLLNSQQLLGSPKFMNAKKMFSKHRSQETKPQQEQDEPTPLRKKILIDNNYQSKKISQEDFTYNNKIIVNQLHYCRFIYYLIKNNHVFCLSGDEKITTCLVLYQHLLKLIKNLSNSQTNFFDLKSWGDFTNSKRYKATLDTLKQYNSRYSLEYQMYLSSLEGVNQDQIEQLKEIFTETQQISMVDYQFIKNKLTDVIKSYRILIQKDLSKQLSPRQTRGKIQGFRSLIKYRKLIQICLSHYEQYEYFQKQSDLKVHTDYQKVSCATKTSYQILKKQLNFL